MTEAWFTYQQLTDELRILCAAKRSGTLFCTTSDARSVRFSLQNGLIVSVKFRNIGGVAALSHIQTIQQCRFKFQDNLNLDQDPDLPSTPELLQLLIGDDKSQSPPTATDFLPSLSELHAIIEQEAADLFGPVAGLICAEQFTVMPRLKDTDDLRTLLTNITVAIGENTKTATLIEQVFSKAKIKNKDL